MGQDTPLYKPGERVGDYVIVKMIGGGGMSQVFEALHPRLEQVSALKVIRPGGRVAPERLLKEGLAMSCIHHPNVVDVRNLFEHQGRLCLVMERVQGGDLEGMDRTERILRAEEIFTGIVKGVRAAHARKMVHRDLKPANVLIDRYDDGTLVPKVMDFGIVQFECSLPLTLPEIGIGTPDFGAPEQMEAAENTTERSDIWSLGAILYWMYADRPPFEHQDPRYQHHAKRTGLLALPPNLPRHLAPIVKRCLQPDPDHRYESSQALLDALGEARGLVTPVTPPVGPVTPFQEPDPRIQDLISSGDLLQANAVIERWMDPFLDHCRRARVDPHTHPSYASTRRRQALALARAGATLAAQEMLHDLVRNKVDDGETLGILARTYKDLAFQARSRKERTRWLKEATEWYRCGYERALERDHADDLVYTGINYATCLYLNGGVKEPQQVAQDVGTRLEPMPESYWKRATMAEALFLLERYDLAVPQLKRAANLGRGRHNDIATTRIQILRILHTFQPSAARAELESQVREILRVPPVVSFSLPPEAARQADLQRFTENLDRHLARKHGVIAYCPAATSLDLGFLRVLRRHKVESHVFLPFERQKLADASAEGPTPDGWSHDLESALKDVDDLVVVNPYTEGTLSHLCAFTRRCVRGEAEARARSHFGTHLRVDPKGALRETVEPEPEPVEEQVSQGLFHHEHRAFLVVGLQGWERLGEEARIRFGVVLRQRIRAALDEVGASYTVCAADGDQALVFEDPLAALRSAFAVHRRVLATSWEVQGLPPTRIRIALHAGPCYSYPDPFGTGRDFAGLHLLTASALCRGVPGGRIWASRHFTALCSLLALGGVRFEYAGRVALPSGGALLATWRPREEYTG